MRGGSRSFHRLEFNSKMRKLKSERRNSAGHEATALAALLQLPVLLRSQE